MATVRQYLRSFLPRLQPRRTSLHRHESLWAYQRGFYLKYALAISLLLIAVYVVHDPAEGPSGSTWFGYLTGTFGASLIFWLAWLGIRKRRFRESKAPAQAWVSAHVYLGLALALIASLHCGFQFGLNVHTLAYIAMMLVIASGIYGAAVYGRIPAQITANREQRPFEAMVEEVAQLNQAALSLADRIDAETHGVVLRSVAAAQPGGSAWEQLSGRYGRQGDTRRLESFVSEKRAQIAARMASALPVTERPTPRQGTIFFVADQIFAGQGSRTAESLQKLLQIIDKRNAALERINRDITLRARLSIWLYVHVPSTVILLGLLLIHVLSVFLYW